MPARVTTRSRVLWPKGATYADTDYTASVKNMPYFELQEAELTWCASGRRERLTARE